VCASLSKGADVWEWPTQGWRTIWWYGHVLAGGLTDPGWLASRPPQRPHRAISLHAASRRAGGSVMPQSAADAGAALAQRRIDALRASDLHALDAMMDERCTPIESNGTARTKAAFLQDVAKRALSFALCEIEENDIR